MSKVEGILLRKVPYKDKHIIGTLLLRNGLKLPIIFYGAQGGGKKHKSNILQLGFLFSVTLSKINKVDVGVASAKEYTEKWFHEKLAVNPKAFYLLYFFCELIEKISPQVGEKGDLDEKVDLHQGLFRLLSNAIFYLERDIEQGKFSSEKSLFIFLTKSLIELGVFPRTEKCVVSGNLITDEEIGLEANSGGFSLAQFLTPEQARLLPLGQGQRIRKSLLNVAQSKYGQEEQLENIEKQDCVQILDYLLYQQHISRSDLKTVSMVI